MASDSEPSPGDSSGAFALVGQSVVAVIAALGTATVAVGKVDVPWVLILLGVIVVIALMANVVRGIRLRNRVRDDAPLNALLSAREQIDASDAPRLNSAEVANVKQALQLHQRGSGDIAKKARRIAKSFDQVDKDDPNTWGALVRKRVMAELDGLVTAIETARDSGRRPVAR